MAMDPRVAMLMQGAGGGGMPQGGGMPPGGMGGGGGLQQLMQMAGPMLQGMSPNTKMQLGAALQTPGVQQMIAQVMQNPQMMQQIMQMAAGGGGGGMPPGNAMLMDRAMRGGQDMPGNSGNPDVMAQLAAMANRGMRGNAAGTDPRAILSQLMQGGGAGAQADVGPTRPITDSELGDVEDANQQVRGNLPPLPTAPYVKRSGPEEEESNPQSTEQELEMLQQLMNRARG